MQLGVERLLFLSVPSRWWGPTLCWSLSYALSVLLRHGSHTVLVFGPHRDHPLLAVGKTYLAYLSTIITSTVVNLALVAGLSFSHEIALLFTASFSMVWSYVALSYTWFGAFNFSTRGYSVIGSVASPTIREPRGDGFALLTDHTPTRPSLADFEPEEERAATDRSPSAGDNIPGDEDSDLSVELDESQEHGDACGAVDALQEAGREERTGEQQCAWCDSRREWPDGAASAET